MTQHIQNNAFLDLCIKIKDNLIWKIFAANQSIIKELCIC